MPKYTFRGGIHPMHDRHEGKDATKNIPVHEFVSDTVCIQMGMHIGPPSKPIVNVGDHVRVGQVIAEPVGALGIPVHASVSGEVMEIAPKPQLGAAPGMCITIQNDFRDEWVEDLPALGNVESVDPEKIVPAIRAAGICGMGGASFPTHIKLTVGEGKYCDTVILNGAECETFLTADHRLMLETPQRVVDGLRAAMRAVNCERGIIAIEENKKDAILVMQEAIRGRKGVEIATLKTKYPQGGEKQLIKAVLGREVPSGKLPLDVHAIVLNVGTAAAIADAITDGKPLISRITTVTGCVKEPKNLLLRIGTIVADVIGECGGYSEEVGKLVMGGGMTGICAPNDDISITKAHNGIVAYNVKDAVSLEEGPCIRCGRCVEACPVGLNPYLLKPLCDADDLAAAKANDVMECIVCGSCSYVCPARRWLTAAFKNAKDKIILASRR